MKKCNKCNEHKELTGFELQNGKPRPICKTCRRPRKTIEQIVDLIGEEWKPVFEFEDRYMISNMGRLKRLSFTSNGRNGAPTIQQEIIIKPTLSKGYRHVALCKNNIRIGAKIHRLVATHFVVNETNFNVINHINGDCVDNRSSNLEWVSLRENSTHYTISTNKTSKHTGVSWDSNSGKWKSYFYNSETKKSEHLGLFTNELEASCAYQNKLKSAGIINKYAK